MELQAVVREKFGKATRGLRKKGLIPAELYGHGLPNFNLSVKERDFESVFQRAGESTIITLVFGEERRPVVVHDIARDYLTHKISHVDFYQVRMDEKIRLRIPVRFMGDAPAVKEKGGILGKVISEIEVEVLPGDMPHEFTVDLRALDDIGKSVYLKDLSVGPRVRILLGPETVLATINAPAEEKGEAPLAVEDVKVETEERKAERETKEGTAEEGR